MNAMILTYVFLIASVADDLPPNLADLGAAPAVVLTDQDGQPFDLAKLRGRTVLVSFIYTTCSGVCPATTHRLGRVRDRLEQRKLWGSSVAFVSITLDPERDTPEALKRYADIYDADDPSWRFVTGANEQINQVITSWGMWAKRNKDGVLDHPSRIFLIDPSGHEREIYSLEHLDPAQVEKDMRAVLGITSK